MGQTKKGWKTAGRQFLNRFMPKNPSGFSFFGGKEIIGEKQLTKKICY